jgi:hypothetical protein
MNVAFGGLGPGVQRLEQAVHQLLDELDRNEEDDNKPMILSTLISLLSLKDTAHWEPPNFLEVLALMASPTDVGDLVMSLRAAGDVRLTHFWEAFPDLLPDVPSADQAAVKTYLATVARIQQEAKERLAEVLKNSSGGVTADLVEKGVGELADPLSLEEFQVPKPSGTVDDPLKGRFGSALKLKLMSKNLQDELGDLLEKVRDAVNIGLKKPNYRIGFVGKGWVSTESTLADVSVWLSTRTGVPLVFLLNTFLKMKPKLVQTKQDKKAEPERYIRTLLNDMVSSDVDFRELVQKIADAYSSGVNSSVERRKGEAVIVPKKPKARLVYDQHLQSTYREDSPPKGEKILPNWSVPGGQADAGSSKDVPPEIPPPPTWADMEDDEFEYEFP